MPAKRPRKTKKRWRGKGSRHSPMRLAHIAIIGGVIIAAWMLWTDHTLRHRFENMRWALSAEVYARPLELYKGMRFDVDQLVGELERLGYRRVTDVISPRQYSQTGGVVSLSTRSFRFPDAPEPARRVKVGFTRSNVTTLTDLDTLRHEPLVRIEPLLIGKIYPYHKEDRILVDIEQVPPMLIKAVLAIEDHRFYRHIGIDPMGILRAMIANLRTGRMAQGGSTLTQQLVKNMYLSSERTLSRKFSEVIMSLLLERRYSKDEILEAYLNEIFLGQDGQRAIHGFGLAARYYFETPLSELDLHQMAMLAGLSKGASYYNPRRHPERALKRRNLVLARLAELGDIDQVTARQQKSEPLGLKASLRSVTTRYPAYMDLVRRQLASDYSEDDIRTEGLRIFTSLDPDIQAKAESALSARIQKLERQHPRSQGLQGAMVVTRKETGEVLAVVGDRKPKYAGFNRALNAKRPVGSLLKPAIFIEALARTSRYHLLSPVTDAPLAWKDDKGEEWRPRNYAGKHDGQLPLYQALARSNNIASVRLAKEIGLTHVKRRLAALGIESSLPDYPSLLLGAVDLPLLDIVRMYQTLASGGYRLPLRAVNAVVGREEKLLHSYALATKQVVKPELALLVNFMLVEVLRDGTARAAATRLSGGMPMAGKTGTTNDLRDSWFAGFNDEILSVVWLGRDDNKPTGLTGASGALEVWLDVMKELPPEPIALQASEHIIWHWIDPDTGLRTDRGCAGAKRYPFSVGSVSPEYRPCNRLRL